MPPRSGTAARSELRARWPERQIAAGPERQIRPIAGPLRLPHRRWRESIAQHGVVPRHNKGYAEHPGDRESQPTCLQPVCVHKIGANEAAQAGQRPDIKAKLFETLASAVSSGQNTRTW